MKERKHSFMRVAQPIRNFAQRFAYIGLVAAAFGLMMLAKVDTVLIERARVHVTDAVAPILDVISRPLDAANQGVDEIKAMKALYEDNSRLREEKSRLLEWKTVAQKLEAENRVLREQLNVVPERGVTFITGRVIADTGGAFSQSVIVNAGKRNGVKRGQAAVTSEGLVGRVVDVGSRSARILLVTDINARVPVLIDPSRTRAIMTGTNAAQPKLSWLPPGAVVAIGDRVVTSGHAGVLPPGLPVGQVVGAGEGGMIVQPFVDLTRLEYVRILDAGLSGILQLPQRAVQTEKGAADRGRGKRAP
ncbi:MAG: rod shape-determining protein MreC [Rhodospirillaceae bacterium]